MFYGKSGASQSVADSQWEQVTHDMDRIRNEFKDTDFVVLGDTNSRVGNPQNKEEERYLGTFGESFRNGAGTSTLNFHIENNLRCVNNRQL